MADAEIKASVDKIITPERADEEAKAFISIVLEVANWEDDRQWHLANVAAKHAFSKTDAFEEAFREFAGFPADRVYSPGLLIEEADAEM
jgi:hypothetical protein